MALVWKRDGGHYVAEGSLSKYRICEWRLPGRSLWAVSCAHGSIGHFSSLADAKIAAADYDDGHRVLNALKVEERPGAPSFEMSVAMARTAFRGRLTTQRQFNKGDVQFQHGDASDRVLRVISREIEIMREVGTASVKPGHVQAGEGLGEKGVIENPHRSATAGGDGAFEVFIAQQFLARVSSAPEERLPEGLEGEASSIVIPASVTIELTAQTDVLRARIGGAPIEVIDLPYVVGRAPYRGEAEPAQHPDLLIEDEKPFRLSRYHFMITHSDNELVISDLGSTLGTIVNEHAIGRHFTRNAMPLLRGENRIVVGGKVRPFYSRCRSAIR